MAGRRRAVCPVGVEVRQKAIPDSAPAIQNSKLTIIQDGRSQTLLPDLLRHPRP
jgi:hypothetical protein